MKFRLKFRLKKLFHNFNVIFLPGILLIFIFHEIVIFYKQLEVYSDCKQEQIEKDDI